ncbi:KxYKxGKxW signal peptide domain-containing protein [Streptococcus ruminantium]|uniref:KxYKxGKxW signal peptide domain-containing protein n=2 Tax=Streptococcus ruminantium TaxID=1917441 RepID=A0ABU1B231_9STRE|nr:KxYKxGKxW signal peptide domain-containing protein [Streptococcus ruminantium]MDQ8758517.1 KxYKxGKxW signal peptide domain-containing protein [Streptococcus ruminantium]MDQ8768122.1 KxYKxGKxW signal peptide domain-containing protein [Streptococcus ruminantium]MDQ8806280.1 KxYKxGKxW signal peptide domain-containing protein [Streptococcus ruminantium]MDQ8832908.1 KxYKxGKxW signal peptide domain-containing protein [Streptococcus ruminantium]MDQ8841919.1 KxYKxGKxW signal peptide domain-containi
MQQKPKLVLKAKGFRMWKSGKRWVFGLGAMTAIFLCGEMQALALETPVESPISTELRSTDSGEEQPPAPKTEEDSSVSSSVESAEESNSSFLDQAQDVTVKDDQHQAQHEVDVTTAKPVHIYYKPTDNGDDYYAHIWENGQAGQDHKMTKDGDQWKVTVTPKPDATFINYIIKKGTGWDNKKTGDMTATVNPYTETNIYVGDNFYSQISNIQTPEFDKKFGYEDKVVDASEPDKFKTVGSLGRLGSTLNDDGTATINLWAPTAKEVKLNLYKTLTPDAKADKIVDMKRGTVANPDDHTQNTVGVWTYKLDKSLLGELGVDTAEKLAYDYTLSLPNAHFIQVEEQQKGDKKVKIYRNSASGKVLNENGEATREEVAAFYAGDNFERKQENNENKIVVKEHNHREVTTQDPYSVAVIQGGTRSVILDPSKVGPKVQVTNNKRAKTNSEISVLEVNVRDFSIDESSGVDKKDRGNYLGFVQSGTKNPNDGTMTGLDYLKYRGTNYLQMMPLNDFETVPELDKDNPENTTISKAEPDGVHNNQQNWGYDPKNYNVPEGSYATDPSDPENRIKELKEMMQKLHDAGLNVTLDVVYNHLYHGQKNVFEQTVPGYYYAINQPANVMNNDIFVGNAVRSNSEMMRRYIVNSTAFWAAEYGMDGFRFDAMSDLDVTTLNEVRKALDKVGPNIVTYGEGWDSMGTYLPKGEAGSDVQGKKIPTYGFFDATSRNAIVGHAHNDHLDAKGFVNEGENNPNIANATQVADSLLGGDRKKYANASQQLNYVECHDGMTLSDLLKRYNVIDTRDPKIHLNRVELATAMSALAQGIHFSQHGQEFLRTKNNSVNTYNSGDEYNKIDWNLVKTHADAVNFSKAITQLRLAEPLFQLSDYNDINEKMVVTNAQGGSGVITYELRLDGKGENKNGKYLVIFNNNNGDSKSSLTLGGNQWYYGGNEKLNEFKNMEGNRGRINSTNDFSNAFIVTSNSKSLYDKIGQKVGQKELTVDPLSATVLFIPAPAKATELKTVERVISYVDRQGNQVSDPHRQAVTFLTVEEPAPDLKFGFENSQIPVAPTDLGHASNIVNKVSKTLPTVKYVYVATSKDGRPIEVNLNLSDVTIGDDGKPVDSDTVKWVKRTQLGLLEEVPEGVEVPSNYTTDKKKWLSQVWERTDDVSYPEVTGHKVQSISPEKAGDKEKVTSSVLGLESARQEVKVTYAKEMTAKLVSENDPLEKLPKSASETSGTYQAIGLEGEAIRFTVSDTDLAREGYTYTVNGKANLTEAMVGMAGYFSATPAVFQVVYTKVETQEPMEKDEPKQEEPPTKPDSDNTPSTPDKPSDVTPEKEDDKPDSGSSPSTPDKPSDVTPEKEDGKPDSGSSPSTPDKPSDVTPEKDADKPDPEVPNSETKKDNTPTLKNEDGSTSSTKRELVDVPTGVRVVLSEKESSEIVALRVTPKSLSSLPTQSVLAGKDYKMYDIDLIDSRGKVVKMAYTARVSLPVATDKAVAQVLYLPQSGQVHSLDFTVQDLGQSGRFVEFTAKSFSDYAVIYQATAQNIEQTNSTSKAINDEQESSLAVAQDSVLSVPVASAAKELPKTAAILPKTGETISVLSLVGLALLGTVVAVSHRRKGK